MDKTSDSKQKKPTLSPQEVNEIQWISDAKEFGLCIGRWKEYFVLRESKTNGPILVYNQAEWDAFLKGVQDGDFDDLAESERR